jgi:hypothetical protein
MNERKFVIPFSWEVEDGSGLKCDVSRGCCQLGREEIVLDIDAYEFGAAREDLGEVEEPYSCCKRIFFE